MAAGCGLNAPSVAPQGLAKPKFHVHGSFNPGVHYSHRAAHYADANPPPHLNGKTLG
ncbi:MAG: hypothetical protein JO283_19585 [Bradyrhizobium sp.]|nr:hypothetical protein [Bradyrhizobium sp.]